MKRLLTRRDVLKAAGVVWGAILAACAPAPIPTSVSKVSPAPQSASRPTPTAGASLEGRTARLWGLQFDPHVETYHRLATLFKEKTGAVLLVEPQAWPLETKLIATMAVGGQPDLICVMGKVCVPLFVQGALRPLMDPVYRAMKVKPEDVFFADAAYSYSWKGDMYGVPVEAGITGNVVDVPVDDVRGLGLAGKYPPTDGRIWFKDYPELFTLARALQIEKDGKVVRWGLSSKGWDVLSYLGILRSLLAERATDWWNLANTRFNVDTEEGVQAMRWLVEDPVKLGIETELDKSQLEAAVVGKVALARGIGGLSDSYTDKLGYNYEIAGSPMCVPDKLPLSCSEAGWGFAAPTGSKKPDVAMEFLKMMLTEEGQVEYTKIYGGYPVPAWKGLVGRFAHWDNPDLNGKAVRMAKKYQQNMLPLARYYGEALGYYSQVDTIFWEVCSLVRQQKMTAAEGCQEAQKRLEAQYKQWLADMKLNA